MFKIMKNEVATGMIYPDAEFLADYKEYDFGSFISSIGMEAMLGKNTRQIGDSGIYVTIEITQKRNVEGIEQLKEYAVNFVSIIKEALPKMSKKYASFYQHFIDDYENNGLYMPMQGKII